MTDSADSPSASRSSVVVGVDQVVASAGNFAFTIFIARSSSIEAFAAVALAYLTVQILIGLLRAGLFEPYLVAGAALDGVRRAALTRRTLGIAGGIGATASALTLGLGWVFELSGDGAVAAVGVLAVVLVVQDALRYVAVAFGGTARLLVSDLVWTATTISGALLLDLSGRASPLLVTSVWGFGAALGLIPVIRFGVDVKGTRAHVALPTNLMATSAYEFALTRMTQYSVAYSLIWFAASSDVAGFRAASSLTNVASVFFAAVPLVMVPDLRRRIVEARENAATGPSVRAEACRVSTVLVLITLLGGAVLLSVPDTLGEIFLGDSWNPARPSLPGMILMTTATGASLGPLMVYRATLTLGLSRRARLTESVVTTVAGLTGAALGGAVGASWAMGTAACLSALVWFVGLSTAQAAIVEESDG